MKLAIISHTRHYKDQSGQIVGWGPTVREINYLLDVFEEVYHCAPLHSGSAPGFVLPYESEKIRFVPLKPSGGESIIDKFSVLLSAPANILTVRATLNNVDAFQFRSPTGMGVYMIPWLNLFVSKKGWFKYAGNWNQQDPPLGYRIQRFLLKNQRKRTVTINGRWDNQKDNFLTFENPCLTSSERNEGWSVLNEKSFKEKLNFCFVGRLESAKGVRVIIDSFLKVKDKKRIGTIHLVGDGKEREEFEELARKSDLDFRFHGFVNRHIVADLLKLSHVFLLPSTASEGFPKVIAEAANFGCVPVVSDVSSIAQYVKEGINGKVLPLSNNNLTDSLIGALEFIFNSSDELKGMAMKAHEMAKPFTFDHYNSRIINDVLR